MRLLDHIQIQLPGALTLLRLTDIITFWTLSISNCIMKHEFSAAGSDSFFSQVLLPCLKTEAVHLPKRRAPLKIIRRTESKKRRLSVTLTQIRTWLLSWWGLTKWWADIKAGGPSKNLTKDSLLTEHCRCKTLNGDKFSFCHPEVFWHILNTQICQSV